jgi:hypothetical protein
MECFLLLSRRRSVEREADRTTVRERSFAPIPAMVTPPQT